jgi:hypothetical protein
MCEVCDARDRAEKLMAELAFRVMCVEKETEFGHASAADRQSEKAQEVLRSLMSTVRGIPALKKELQERHEGVIEMNSLDDLPDVLKNLMGVSPKKNDIN